jgi:hypothetical protein
LGAQSICQAIDKWSLWPNHKEIGLDILRFRRYGAGYTGVTWRHHNLGMTC